jgi:hypothetical protein
MATYRYSIRRNGDKLICSVAAYHGGFKVHAGRPREFTGKESLLTCLKEATDAATTFVRSQADVLQLEGDDIQ